MSKLKSYLAKHLGGDILDDKSALDYFATDGSIFSVQPRAVVYPETVTDVRKVCKFSWQLAERGKHLPVTARGKGTDQGGAAIGEGLVLAMPAHMNRLLNLERESVTVEPGMIYGDLQRTLYSHGRFLPPYPASMEYSTVGGAVANNAAGEKTLKYGTTADYIKELEVVLANGDVIRTLPLSKKELSKKKGQSDFEGDIYRAVDGLLQDNAELIKSTRPDVSKNAAGYALGDVWRPDGKFDLSRLFVGSQGTLGMVTEITFATEAYNPDTHLVVAYFDQPEQLGQAVESLQSLQPSAMEVVDSALLEVMRQERPAILENLMEDALPGYMLLIEFDNDKSSSRKRKAKKAQKLMRNQAAEVIITDNPEEQQAYWRIRRSATTVLWNKEGKQRALPLIEDSIVPIQQLPIFLQQVRELFNEYNLSFALWGHGGNAHFHLQPFFDLENTGDRQTIFKLMDSFYRMVVQLGGSTSGEHNDGRLRAPYLRELYGDDLYQLLRQVKDIFDPYHILNPGVKIDVTKDHLRKQMRHSYDLDRLYDHMPRAHH